MIGQGYLAQARAVAASGLEWAIRHSPLASRVELEEMRAAVHGMHRQMFELAQHHEAGASRHSQNN